MTDRLNMRDLRDLEERILIHLTDFYLEIGFQQPTHDDPERGGLYENKLAVRLGYPPGDTVMPPAEVTAATKRLEARGLVRRIRRVDGQELMGVWPTPAGLDRAHYIRATLFERVRITYRENDAKLLVTVVTSLATTLVSLVAAGAVGLLGWLARNF